MLASSAVAFLLLLLPQAPSAPPESASPAAPSPAPEARPAPDGAVLAIDTTMGTIEVGLYESRVPLSSRNILKYAKSGFYSGTTFHRVIPGFMIQGGGMDAKRVEKPVGAPVRSEARNSPQNLRGTVALARTDDPHSATAQFFINVKDNPALDFGISRDGWGYTVFGEVLSGMDVVDRIAAVPTTRIGRHENMPIRPVVITGVRVLSEPPPKTPPAGRAAPPEKASPDAKPAPKPAPKVSPVAAPSKPKTTPTPRGR